MSSSDIYRTYLLLSLPRDNFGISVVVANMPVDLNAGSVPSMYRELFELISTPGLDRLTQTIFTSLFESPSLSKATLNQIWYAVTKSSSMASRHEFYKCLALMALVQQGKPIDERLLENYVNRELPSPTLESRVELGDRLVRLLRADQTQANLCFRYNDLCSLDTIQVDLAPAKKGVILRHHEYEISSMRHRNKVSRRYNEFIALDELLNAKYPYRILPPLPPKKSVNGHLVGKEFIEERRRSLKNYLQILSRHPTICETDIVKFFLTFQGNGCADSMKATYKNLPDEFGAEPRTSIEKSGDDAQGIQFYRTSQTHLTFLHQQFQLIRTNLRKINERKASNALELTHIEQSLQTLSADQSIIDRWATGPNDYWPAIQIGLASLPVEINAVSERLTGQVQRDNELINEHLDMLIDLLEGYKTLCRRFDEALQTEQKAMQKSANQSRRSLSTTTAELASNKTEMNLEMLIKRNSHALKCLQKETQLVYANLEGFVYILSNLGNSQHQGSSDLFTVWKSFATKVAQLGQNYISKSAGERTNLLAGYRH